MTPTPLKKITILTSCTGEKHYHVEQQLLVNDFQSMGTPAFDERFAELEAYSLPAEQMYTGQQQVRLMNGLQAIRQNQDFDVNLHIVSAGYGVIPGDQVIVPYECTFQTMKAKEIIHWSNHLQIPEQARRVLYQSADLIIVILGQQYLKALQLGAPIELGGPTLFFTASEALKNIPAQDGMRLIPLTSLHAQRYHCVLVGLKGELVGRILRHLDSEGEPYWSTLMEGTTDLYSLLDEPAPPKKHKSKMIERLAVVDRVIQVSTHWQEKFKAKPIRFFIPDWDDMVDPNYDFATDTHAGGRSSWSNQVYAHQMFFNDAGFAPNYDGLLVSRAVAESSQSKIEHMRQVGIHSH